MAIADFPLWKTTLCAAMVLSLCDAPAIAGATATARSDGTGSASGIVGNVEQRGEHLRGDIEQTYRNRVRQYGGLPSMVDDNSPVSDVTELVKSYIPVGTSFAEAELLLRVAGFRVDKHPPSDQTCPKRNHIAAILPISRDIFQGVNCVVILAPMKPCVYDFVSLLSAGLVRSNL